MEFIHTVVHFRKFLRGLSIGFRFKRVDLQQHFAVQNILWHLILFDFSHPFALIYFLVFVIFERKVEILCALVNLASLLFALFSFYSFSLFLIWFFAILLARFTVSLPLSFSNRLHTNFLNGSLFYSTEFVHLSFLDIIFLKMFRLTLSLKNCTFLHLTLSLLFIVKKCFLFLDISTLILHINMKKFVRIKIIKNSHDNFDRRSDLSNDQKMNRSNTGLSPAKTRNSSIYWRSSSTIKN